jgi:hypothetical protein
MVVSGGRRPGCTEKFKLGGELADLLGGDPTGRTVDRVVDGRSAS